MIDARRVRISDAVSKLVVGAVLALGAALLLVPAAVVVLLSFSDDRFLSFPPRSWGLRQYDALMSQTAWHDAVVLSLQLAAVTAVASILLAVPTALVLARSRLRGRFAIEGLGLIALVLPISAYAVAMYAVFAQLRLLGSFAGLVIADLVISFPLTFLVVSSALGQVPRELELAAMTMGAGRVRAWLGVTLRLVLPAIVAGGLLAFITAFDEAVFINFLGGPDLVTLPKAIFDSVRYEVDPVITAIATVVMAVTTVLMVVSASLRKGLR